ncbi:MAG: threonine-phosphate decarboxylase [Candidatus Omnitrophica bacterium]|nr:threonine-phosphate decarboxylase [Candidatus Omnitrophota bacterium]
MIDRIHGGNIDIFSKRYKLPTKKVIDFSASINPLGFSPRVRIIIQRNIGRLVHYPDPESMLLKNALAKFHDIKSENLLVANGSIELIYLIPKALAAKRILIPVPSFSEYEFASRINGSNIFFIKLKEENNFRISINEMIKFIPKVNLVFVSNPNNPTSGLLSYDEILMLINECVRYKTMLVIDEVFIDFVSDSDKLTMIYRATKNKYLLIIRSLTKFFGLPGIRLGYFVGNPNLINTLSRHQYPWAVNSLAQATGMAVIQDYEYIKKSKEFIATEKAFLFERLKNLKNLSVYYPSANFILCKLEGQKNINAGRLADSLARQGIMIRDCSNFRGLDNRFFRIAVRKRKENLRLVSNLKEILS